jgi:hypothetical protein
MAFSFSSLFYVLRGAKFQFVSGVCNACQPNLLTCAHHLQPNTSIGCRPNARMMVASTRQIVYAGIAVGGSSHPTRYVAASRFAFTAILKGRCMSQKSAWASLVVAVALGFILTSCKDTKTLQENEQLKAQVADLQKQVGQVGNNLDTVTADRDNLKKENDELKAQLNARKPKRAKKKAARKRRQTGMLWQPALIQDARGFGFLSDTGGSSHENI